MGEPFDKVESELVRFRVEKGAKEPRPPSDGNPWFSQHPALFAVDVLRANVLRVLYVQGVDALEKPLLVALAQILLQALDVSSKEPLVCNVANPVNAYFSRRIALFS